MNKLLIRAGLHALGTLIYSIFVAFFLNSLRQFNIPEGTAYIPIAMLLLLVTSASITGLLVLGKPLMLYHDKKKKEALQLLGYTIGILAVFTIVAFSLLIVGVL